MIFCPAPRSTGSGEIYWQLSRSCDGATGSRHTQAATALVPLRDAVTTITTSPPAWCRHACRTTCTDGGSVDCPACHSPDRSEAKPDDPPAHLSADLAPAPAGETDVRRPVPGAVTSVPTWLPSASPRDAPWRRNVRPRLERKALELLGETNGTTGLRGAALKQATEPRLHPRSGRVRRVDHEAASEIDRDQLKRRQPDLKRALTDRLQQPCADLLPGSLLRCPRRRQSLPHGGEVDPDRSPTCATALGEVRLLDQNLVSDAPPSRGAGGVKGSGVLGFPTRARVGRRGLCRGFCRGLCRGFARKCPVSAGL